MFAVLKKFFIAIFLCCIIFNFQAAAQKILISDLSLKDSASVSRNISVIASRALSVYSSNSKSDLYDGLFRLQIVAGQYESALSSIDSIRSSYGAQSVADLVQVGFPYEVYCRAHMAMKTSNLQTSSLFDSVAASVYSRVLPDARAELGNYLSVSPSDLSSRYSKLISQLLPVTGDSLDLSDAYRICKTYNSLLVISEMYPRVQQFILEDENSKYIFMDSLLIPMKDGGTLSAIMVKKRLVSEKRPVILMYNIYAGPSDRAAAKEMADHGYIGVVVNTRGKYLSKDSIFPFEHDANDAYEMIDYLSHHNWCDGRVGMYGGSYLGFSQWSACKKMHPALKTIVPQVAVGIGVDFPMMDGIRMTYMLQWSHFVSNTKLTDYLEMRDQAKWSDLCLDWYKKGLPLRALDSLEGRKSYLFQRWLDHPLQDNFWQSMVPFGKEFSKINIPILTTTGYFDDDQRGALYYYQEHLKYNPKAEHYLLIGPYDHSGGQSEAQESVQGITVDSAAIISINKVVFEWFDHIFDKKPMPELLKDKVNFEVMGRNAWRHTPSLQAMNTDTIRYYLSSEMNKNNKPQLSLKQDKVKNDLLQVIDMKDRSDGQTWIDNAIPILQDTVLWQSGLMEFESPAIIGGINMNGSFCGKLIFSINKKDFDPMMYLYEKKSDGTYVYLSNYMCRASMNNDRTKRSLLTPDKTYSVDINNSFMISRKIEQGSKLVLLLGIVKNPLWEINYGTGGDVSRESIKDASEPLRIKWSNESWIGVPAFGR
jgi:uncharacterized protein